MMIGSTKFDAVSRSLVNIVCFKDHYDLYGLKPDLNSV